MSSSVAIQAVDLSKVYRSGESELVIFSGLNLEVEQGEQVALVGESGAGKSTLLHLLGGLDLPTKGAIYLLLGPFRRISPRSCGAARP